MSCLAASAHALAASETKCNQLTTGVSGWPDASTRIESATWRANGFEIKSMMGSAMLPAHCEVIGVMRERVGEAGQHYAIRFKLRLPESWNQRFFFQGGGGTNGDIGDATGNISAGRAECARARLCRRLAGLWARQRAQQRAGAGRCGCVRVRSSGASGLRWHLAQARCRGGEDGHRRVLRQQARSGRISSAVPRAARRAWRSRSAIRRSSTGSSPASPGFSLPRAAVAEAWDTQAFASSDRAGQVRGSDRCHEAARHVQSCTVRSRAASGARGVRRGRRRA